MGVISRAFPTNSFKIVQHNNPQLIPWLIEKVRGIRMMLKKAGTADDHGINDNDVHGCQKGCDTGKNFCS
jgi:hypothetical protein